MLGLRIPTLSRRWGGRVAALVAVSAMAGCAGASDAAAPSGSAAGGADGAATTLSLVGYSTPQVANEAIEALWAETPEGAGVAWVESYGASGDQSRAVAAGLEADYVHLSLEPDVTRLVDEGLVDPGWNQDEHGGIVSSSVVVIAVRPGNPLGIESWQDLTEPGVEIVTPNPTSSGGARWNVLAVWAAALADGADDAGAEEFTKEVLSHVVSLPASARDATSAFLAGTGDVLLSYENEAILARASGEELDYVVPDVTMRIDNPGAVLEGADPKARDWYEFLFTPEAQAEFARTGYRPVVDGVTLPEVPGANDPSDPFPAPSTLYTIDDFGGWAEAAPTYFDEEDGIVTALLQDVGVAG
ncbi:extracellular solute-binding protein [Demequina gelatinilytica]|uniref:extracellular solute-binding protein n=1 Tax=Demequina gelatinilytica TaxID=1638980 RepID=UPI0007839D18|nr:extracellular solute-binding protein [Demequina gelatinilytica]